MNNVTPDRMVNDCKRQSCNYTRKNELFEEADQLDLLSNSEPDKQNSFENDQIQAKTLTMKK